MSLRKLVTKTVAVATIAGSIAFGAFPVSAQNLQTAEKLQQQATQLSQQGRLVDAIGILRQALEILEKALGPSHPNVAVSLNNLAELYHAQGYYADAEPLFKRSLAILEKALGASHPNVAVSLNNLALLYNGQGRYADAEPLFKRSLAIREKSLGADHPEVAISLNNLAFLYNGQGRYADAEPLFKRSLPILEKALGASHPNFAAALANLGVFYRDHGRYADADPLFKRSLAIREKSLGADHPDVAASLDHLAQLFLKQLDYAQSNYAEAELLLKRSLAIRETSLGPDHPNVAASLNNLASLYNGQGRYADAEPLFKRSLPILEKALGASHPNVATSLNNLAFLYNGQGRYADAEPLFKRSLAIREKSLGADHPEVAISLNNLALLYNEQGRYADAEPLLNRSLAVLEKALGASHPNVATSLNNLAEHYNQQARYSDALPIVRRTIASGQAHRGTSLAVLSGSEQAKLINARQTLADSYNVLQLTATSEAAAAVAKLSQRFAAGSDDLAALVRRDQDLSAERERLDKALIAAASKPPKERNAAQEEQQRQHLAAIAAEQQRIQTSLSQRFPDYVALSRPAPLSIQETQVLLADDEAMVAISIEEKKSYAWVITGSDAFWTEIPANSKEISEKIAHLRRSLTFEAGGKSVDLPFDAALSHQIYQQTLGPIAAKISGKKRISVFANGALTSLPLGLLVTSDPSGKALKHVDWLINSHAITIIPSIYSLKTMRSQAATSSAPKPLLAFADPVFARAGATQAPTQPQIAMRSMTSFYQGSQIDLARLSASLTPLPATRTEVQAVGKALGATSDDLKLGRSATETAVKQTRLDQYRIVYFATHGMVAGQVEQFSKAKAEPALALTIPNNPTEFDDGLLQASEIAQLKLNADWAVLSACNTASADGVGAEALSGLARAFLYAGARSLVVSHWDVADDATQWLMSSLFDISSNNRSLSHGEAMQRAMLKLLNDAKTEDEAHPRYWAPFVVVGEPGKSR